MLLINPLKFLLLLLPAACWPALLSAATLTVVIENVRADHGQILLALHHYYDEKASWHDQPYQTAVIELDGHQPPWQHVFAGLPAGDYAIRLFHDLNNNQRLDTNSSGIPLEPFAFSLAPEFADVALPALDQALLSLAEGDNTVSVLLLKHTQAGRPVVDGQ